MHRASTIAYLLVTVASLLLALVQTDSSTAMAAMAVQLQDALNL